MLRILPGAHGWIGSSDTKESRIIQAGLKVEHLAACRYVSHCNFDAQLHRCISSWADALKDEIGRLSY